MNTATTKKNTPELRFPGFLGEWSIYEFGDVVKLGKEKFDPQKSKKYPHSIELESIEKDTGEVIKYIPTQELKSIKNVYQLGDVLYGKLRPYLRKFVHAKSDGVCTTEIWVFKTKKVEPSFLFYFIQGSRFNYFANVSAGSKMPRAEWDFVSASPIHFPKGVDEQAQIANFLESVDKLIKSFKTQKEKLEEYKRGIMQKIFSQEVRFKDEDGKYFPEWQKMPVGHFLKERKEYSTKGNGYPHISLTTAGVVPKSERYHRDFLVKDDKSKKYKITRLNDLCYNPANLKFNVIDINRLGDGIFSPIYITYEITEQDIDFVGYYLTHSSFINKARRFEEGTVYERMAVKPDDFVRVEIAMPSVDEQKRIANFLSDIDELITAKSKQIEKAEAWKKGLLQKMFV
ncbi:MAG: restriction endonuclease subunit S [Patescibacteria group bacterium UBA2163]